MKKTTSINIATLTRVEGEGALDLRIEKNKITELKLRIYEPPRLFEKFLVNRSYNEVIDFVSRICGICPVAYQMTAVHAIESIFQINPDPWVRKMRRLLYCGEWIESHSLHMHLLALPDFLGFDSALSMAKEFPNEVRRGLKLQQLGNAIVKFFGGRSVHPVGVCVGGFYRAPMMKDALHLLIELEKALPEAESLARWAAQLKLPKQKQDFICISLQHPDEYPINEGVIVTNNGDKIPNNQFEQHFQEQQVPHSTALHCLFHGKDYCVGPLARLNLNHHLLPEPIQELIKNIGLTLPSQNMFHSIIARAIEIYYAFTHAIELLREYERPNQSHANVTPKAGVGYAGTEAPRGLLWHRYEMDDSGLVKASCIVPPTSQNQARIEKDLLAGLNTFGLRHKDEDLRLRSEMIIRNYDPCISCSTHFLKLKVNRK